MTAINPLAAKFDALFDKKLRLGIPHHEAYEEAEKEFEHDHNCRKYSSFDSYRKSRSRRIKKRN
jgi:hypothetical protein